MVVIVLFFIFFMGNGIFLQAQNNTSNKDSNYNLAVKIYEDAIDKYKEENEKEAFQLYLKAYALYPKVIYFEDHGLLLEVFDQLVKDRYKCLNKEKAAGENSDVKIAKTDIALDKKCAKQLQNLETQMQNQISLKQAEIKDLNEQISQLQEQLDKKDAQIEDLQKQLEENIHLKRVWRARALRLPPYNHH
jgi:flagellar biosynthesis chaperone FliJ